MIADAWRANAAAWWGSDEWHAYELAYGDAVGTRTKLLAEATWSTRVIDLTQEPLAILRGMRKGRRAEIQKAERLHYPLAGANAFQLYATMHQQQWDWPRTPETYACQAAWVKQGHATVSVVLSATHGPIAAALFISRGVWSYYASAAYTQPNVLALAIWHGLLRLRSAGVRYLEAGWQGHAETEKERAIEAYRRHFGGQDVPVRLP